MIPKDMSQLDGLHLFCNPYSNCSGRVMLAVAEKELDVQIHEIDLLKGEQLSLEYYAINPTCDLPAIVHNGIKMGDSITILRYLENVFPEKSLTPTDPIQKKLMDDLLDEAARSHMEYIVPWIYAKGLGRLPTPEQKAFYDKYVPHRSQFHNDRTAGKTATNLNLAEQALNNALNKLEERLTHHKFLVGDSYSLADVAWFPSLFLIGKIFGFSLKKYPAILRWMLEIEKRPAFLSGIKAHLKSIPFWLLRLIIKVVRLTGGRR